MKCVIIVNGGLFNVYGKDEKNKNVFDRDELDVVFKDWSKGKDLVDEDGEVYSVEGLIDYGDVDLVNEEMCEMGDDFVNVSVVELDE